MESQRGRCLIGRLALNADILDGIKEICCSRDIRTAIFQIIGAVQNVRLGYYDQDKKQYQDCVVLDKRLEIASCSGNISVFNDEIMAHAHIVLADHQGQCYGGHLMPGSRIFAAEYFIQELTDVELVREFDKETGLNLWRVDVKNV